MIFLAVVLLLFAMPARAGDIVSLNLCADDYLAELAPDRIAALSPLARDPSLSVVADAARHLPWVRPDAEAVLALHPRLILAAEYGAQATLAVLQARGLRIERVRLAQDFPAIRAETRRLAALLGAEARGEALLADMDARLAAIPAHPPISHPRVAALALEPRGYTAGPGTLADAVLRAAGLANAGTGIRPGLEVIAVHPPDLLVVSQPPAFPSLATDLLAHPVLRGIPRRFVPPALLLCGGPWTARAATLLAR